MSDSNKNFDIRVNLLDLVILMSDETESIQNKYQDLIASLKTKLNPPFGKSILGNLSEGTIISPTESDFQQYLLSDPKNLFQNIEIPDYNDFNQAIKEIRVNHQNQLNPDLKFILDHYELYQKLEEQIFRNITDSDIEIIVTDMTFIANKYFIEYEQIKTQLLSKQETIEEKFVYHGTELLNHHKIIEKNFIFPGEQEYEPKDPGFFGQGINSTDNIFYASMYSKSDFHVLNYNEKGSVLCCTSIFNTKYEMEAGKSKSYYGNPLPDAIKENYGIAYSLIGSSNGFYKISEKEKEKNFIYANDFVFPNKYQIIPMCSLTVMRTDSFVLWADEKKKYKKHFGELKRQIIINAYYTNEFEDLCYLANKKCKRNLMRMIISFESEEWLDDVIQNVRKIIKSDVICLIFSEDQKQIEYLKTKNIENVLFTNNFKDLHEFSSIEMNIGSVNEFIAKLSFNMLFNFQINKSTLLNFSLFDENDTESKSIFHLKDKHPIENFEILCTSCQQKIKEREEMINFSGFSYHVNCIKCAICDKKLENYINFDDFVCITPGMFLCVSDYEIYKSEQLPPNVFNEYRTKMIKNTVKEIFQPIIFNNDKVFLNESNSNDLFIDKFMIDNLYHLNKNYEYFIPHVKFHFESSPEKINFIELVKNLPEDMCIIGIDEGSTILTIAFLMSNEILNSKYEQIVHELKLKFDEVLGSSIIGNVDGEPLLTIPTKKDAQQYFSQKSTNLLQNTIIIEQVDFENLVSEIKENLKKKKNINIEYIFNSNNIDMFMKAEKQIHENIENNGVEMIIIGETIIANKRNKEYESIKEEILEKGGEPVEYFLYHGTVLPNHPKIIENHFLMPGVDKMKTLDNGYFGKGIYATDNIFYASKYANNYHNLDYNEKASFFCCRTICNYNYVDQLNPESPSWQGLPLPEEKQLNYGIFYAVVGSDNYYFCIFENEKDKHPIFAEEYVFPNKLQIIPICSFTVMRTDYLLLWMDETNMNYILYNELKQNVNDNFYYKLKNVDAIDLIDKKKKRNVMKLIVTFSKDSFLIDFITQVRKIINSNFVCLIFGKNKDHLNVAAGIQNVLYTDNVEDLKYFCSIKMTMKNIMKFSEMLEKEYDIRFNLNQSSILNFNIYDILKSPPLKKSKHKK